MLRALVFGKTRVHALRYPGSCPGFAQKLPDRGSPLAFKGSSQIKPVPLVDACLVEKVPAFLSEPEDDFNDVEEGEDIFRKLKVGLQVLLLDEVAAHLDHERREALFESLMGLGGQVWFSGTDAETFVGLRGRAQFFAVANGAVSNGG